ncbi:MAG: thrombospondin type 3 repeat-containing protein [Pseudomonadota bacterium]
MNQKMKTLLRVGAACSAALWSTAAVAVNFNVDGQVTTCSAIACGAAGIAVGDPITGFFTVDDAAAGPNSTFTEADVTEVNVQIGELGGGDGAPELGAAALTTDADGEIISGTAGFTTQVDTGFGIANVELSLDAAAQTWQATTTFLGLGTIATGTLTFMRDEIADSDGDGVADDADNCIEVANADQRDTDGDLYGNLCDADLNNDLTVNVLDLGIFRTVFFSDNADADFNGDGVVNISDLGILRALFFRAPGPSGTAP